MNKQSVFSEVPGSQATSSNESIVIDPTLVDNAESKLDQKDKIIKELKMKVRSLEVQNLQFIGSIKNLESKIFSYDSLKTRPVTFKNLCGLTVDQFNMVFECILPYLENIPYSGKISDFKSERSLTKETEFLCVLTMCRHGLAQSITA